VRVVLAEDSLLLRAGIVRLLADAGFDVVGQAADAEELLRKVRGHRPDVAVIDIEDAGAALAVRGEWPEVGASTRCSPGWPRARPTAARRPRTAACSRCWPT
jgi:DNA-binding NarL/FixJ family response regulator